MVVPRTLGIPFSAEMVRAIQANRKRVTRRLMNPQPPKHSKHARVEDQWVWYDPGKQRDHYELSDCRKPRYLPGDILWVREAWRTFRHFDGLTPSQIDEQIRNHESLYIRYLADGSGPANKTTGRYRHARFMPRRFGRIWLTVEDVRPERVQEMTMAEFLAEGMPRDRPSDAFMEIWDRLHPDHPFELDPWCWRYAFSRTERPEPA